MQTKFKENWLTYTVLNDLLYKFTLCGSCQALTPRILKIEFLGTPYNFLIINPGGIKSRSKESSSIVLLIYKNGL